MRLNPASQARLQKLHALQPDANPAFDRELAKAATDKARRFISGVKSYRRHPGHRKMPEAPVIRKDGSTLLRDYNPSRPGAPAVLVIPSLINRFEILDLDHNRSFLRALAEQGFRPLVIDWDMPGGAEKGFGMTEYVLQRLLPALEIASGGVTCSVHIIGYCMGGNLALALAALRPELVRTLTLMATPWDFHKPDPVIGAPFLAMLERIEPHLDALGLMPVDFIQTLFGVFQPLQVVGKFTSFADLDPSSEEARHFVLLEDWLNDGVPLAANVARECLRGWYGENRTARLEWQVGGTVVDPRQLDVPAYVIAPGKDRIVPPESALPLARLLPHATLHEPMMGHIGLLASRQAPAQVWAALFRWLTAHK